MSGSLQGDFFGRSKLVSAKTVDVGAAAVERVSKGDSMADFTGTIVNFTQAHIDNDGVPYFEFALQLPPPPNPPDPPIENILYINLRKHHAPSAVVAVTSAWANQIMVDVFLEPQSQGKMRVLGVVPAR